MVGGIMKSTMGFGILVVLLSVGGWAQNDNNQQNGNASAGTSNAVTVRGCLTGAAGAYVLLADQKGTPYKLRGGNDLDRMIQHEIEVTGLALAPASDRTETSSQGQDRTQVPSTTLQVSSVREIADTCAVKPAR